MLVARLRLRHYSLSCQFPIVPIKKKDKKGISLAVWENMITFVAKKRIMICKAKAR